MQIYDIASTFNSRGFNNGLQAKINHEWMMMCSHLNRVPLGQTETRNAYGLNAKHVDVKIVAGF